MTMNHILSICRQRYLAHCHDEGILDVEIVRGELGLLVTSCAIYLPVEPDRNRSFKMVRFWDLLLR